VVVLPNGLVAVVGGSSEQDHLQDYTSRVKTIEIYRADPLNHGTIAVSPDMDRSRMYHSTVIVQPDASLLLGGGQFKENGADGSEYNGQVYYPPYFSEIRPVITGTDPLTMSYGSLFTVYTNDTTGIAKVTMLRLSATTHDADMNARFINLTEHSRTSNSVTVKTPVHPAIAPPGDYMLFLVTDGGVPSMARYVRIS
jgi:hypothetical protein